MPRKLARPKANDSLTPIRRISRAGLEFTRRLFHGNFSYGAIAVIDGIKLEIDLGHFGRKKVLDSFGSAG